MLTLGESIKPFSPNFDQRDAEIVAERAESCAAIPGPRVGDFVRFPGEEHPRRFTYDWGEEIQTTVGPVHPCFGDSRFHLGRGGASFSGSLDHSIPKARLTLSDESLNGSFWIFHHGWAEAHNGVTFSIPCRVFIYSPE